MVSMYHPLFFELEKLTMNRNIAIKLRRLNREPRLTPPPRFFLHIYENVYAPEGKFIEPFKLVVTNSGIAGKGTVIKELNVDNGNIIDRVKYLIRLFGIRSGYILNHTTVEKLNAESD